MTTKNKTKAKEMDSYTACSIVEGFSGEEHSLEEQLEAWQWLHDTRVGYSLQGWYGRQLTELIADGHITP